MLNVQRPALLALLLSACLCFGCESDPQQSTSDAEKQDSLRDLPVAVEDPVQSQRVMNDFAPQELTPAGLPVEMQLPEGVIIKQSDEVGGWLILNEAETFKLVVVPDNTDIMDLALFWKGNPEGYRFRKMLIETSQGIMFEAARNDQVEYHLDYVFRGSESLRFYNAKDKPFSQYEVERMFHACRTMSAKQE